MGPDSERPETKRFNVIRSCANITKCDEMTSIKRYVRTLGRPISLPLDFQNIHIITIDAIAFHHGKR